MTEIIFKNFPEQLREWDQWVLWVEQERDGTSTKIPVMANGSNAKSNDPETWSSFAAIQSACANPTFNGPGFMFSESDPFCGIDLDGCRDPETGKVSEWAREIILKLDTYSEISPSKTGVKLFCIGRSPFGGGKKLNLPEEFRIGTKSPAIEIYDKLRYFAVTGWKVRGPSTLSERQEQLNWLKEKYWSSEPERLPEKTDFHSADAVFERARKYLLKLPEAISGQKGHNATFHAACVLVLGFELSEDQAYQLMLEYNHRCHPPWSEKELRRKVSEAAKQTGQRGYLRNAAPSNWQRIPVPTYQLPLPVQNDGSPRTILLCDAVSQYIDSIASGKANLFTTSIPDLDYALSGGVAPGELVLFAARPSHGKSALGLQFVHASTEFGRPCVIVSEEMSHMMLGRRTLQFITECPDEHWPHQIINLRREVEGYRKYHRDCMVVEGCGTAERAAEAIEKAVREIGAECAVVDYAQLLRSPGKTPTEQVRHTSIVLRQLASGLKIVLVALCQLSRAIENRGGVWLPVMSDLKESGQLEQDADVIVFLCWPHRMNQGEPESKYLLQVSKNRNRAIRGEPQIVCKFNPNRQTIMDRPVDVGDRSNGATTYDGPGKTEIDKPKPKARCPF